MFINWKLISHPANWFTIVLMLILAGMAGHLFLTYAGVTPATSDQKS